MSIQRADFDGVMAALGFPQDRGEKNKIENKVAEVAEACDLAYIYIPFLQALYGAFIDIRKAEGVDETQLLRSDFLSYLDKFEAPGCLFALEIVFCGELMRNGTVGEHFYTESESVYKITDSERTLGYVRINEEKFYMAATGEVINVYLYINAM